MADEADKAQELQEQALQIALGKQKSKPKMNATGRCLWCSEPTGERGLFCDSDCRDDYEKSKKFRGIR